MKINQVHAHFLISIGNYSNERIGFSATLEEGETEEEVVARLRKKAVEIVGAPAEDLYNRKWKAEQECRAVETRMARLTKEWDAMTEFLKAQGINPDAPPMPQFNNLLNAAKVEEETVSHGEIIDADGDAMF
jgi:superfamily II DNA or RNA helicase